MQTDIITKILTREKSIGPEALYKLVIEVNDSISEHHGKCNPGTIDLIGNNVFCRSCKEVLLRFCPFCGSTRIDSEEHLDICSNCGEAQQNYFYLYFNEERSITNSI